MTSIDKEIADEAIMLKDLRYLILEYARVINPFFKTKFLDEILTISDVPVFELARNNSKIVFINFDCDFYYKLCMGSGQIRYSS